MNDFDVSRISDGSVFTGKITSEGDVHIDGNFDGSFFTKQGLVVGKSAHIKGDLICRNAELSGCMESGSLAAKGVLTLKPTSVVQEGELSFQQIQVDLGARVEGTFHLIPDEKEVPVKENDNDE